MKYGTKKSETLLGQDHAVQMYSKFNRKPKGVMQEQGRYGTDV